MNTSKTRWLPLTGIAFIILMIVGFIVGGEPPDASSPPEEISQFYIDNDKRLTAAVVILVAATIALVYFASYLRTVLDRGEGENGLLSRVAFIGAVVFAVGGAIDGTILVAISEAVDELDPTQVQTLQALWDNDYVPLMLGIILFTLSSGLSIVLHKSLPAWLGWTAIVIGVAGLVPVGGWVAFPGAGVWILIVSVVLLISEGKASTPVVE